MFVQRLWQFRNVHRNPPRLVFRGVAWPRIAGSALPVGSAYNNSKFWKTKSVGLFSSSPTLQQKVFEIKLTLAAMQRTTATQAH